MKIAYKGEADNFINMIEEIKKISDEKQTPLPLVKGVDEEASSDDHDDKEDF